MIEWAVVGRQVVCKDTDWAYPNWYNNIRPRLGQILTIREIVIRENLICFLFEEIVNKKYTYLNGYSEKSFRYYHFRPVKETSIDCFKSILEKTPEELETV